MRANHWRISWMIFWLKMRISELEVPASHLLIKGQPKETFTSYAPKLSDALEKYCRLKGAARVVQIFITAKRSIGYVIEHSRHRPFDAYSTADATSLKDWLIDDNLRPHQSNVSSPPFVQPLISPFIKMAWRLPMNSPKHIYFLKRDLNVHQYHLET